MKTLLICFALAAVTFYNENVSGERVKITGTSFNTKEGPKIKANDGFVYLIDNKSWWDKESSDKKVVVTGELIEVKRELKAYREEEKLRQQINYPKDTVIIEKHIINAEYELVKE